MKDNVITMEDINKAIEDLKRGPTSHFTAEDVKEFMDRHEKLMRDGINDFPEFEVYRDKKDFSGVVIDTDRLKPKKEDYLRKTGKFTDAEIQKLYNEQVDKDKDALIKKRAGGGWEC